MTKNNTLENVTWVEKPLPPQTTQPQPSKPQSLPNKLFQPHSHEVKTWGQGPKKTRVLGINALMSPGSKRLGKPTACNSTRPWRSLAIGRFSLPLPTSGSTLVNYRNTINGFNSVFLIGSTESSNTQPTITQKGRSPQALKHSRVVRSVPRDVLCQ